MDTRAFLDKQLSLLDEERRRIEACLERLSDDAIWRRVRPGTNSIGNLCLHLAGNESYYIGQGVGLSGYQRERSREFTTEGGVTRLELIAGLTQARETTRQVFADLSADDMSRPLSIDHPEFRTVLSVILHVVEHYAYHTGQILLLTRLFQERDERLLPWGH